MENRWHVIEMEEILAKLQVKKEKGLSEEEAERRLELVGPNTIREQKRLTPVAVFFMQFKDFMVLVLIAAAAVSGLLGEYADAATILAIITLNAVLGFIQEYRAERSLDALKKMTAPEARVKRGGVVKKIKAARLVPGDVVLLDTGDIIPADIRLFEANKMEVSEAALTGESVPVRKNPAGLCQEGTALGDRRNMGYLGTVVTRGKGAGVVVETGMYTEMGQIAGYIEAAKEEETPLQRRLAHLGRWLVFSCLAVVGVVVISGVLGGEPIYKMVLTGVSLAVAAIPEGLPAIVTVSLALGVQKMAKKKAIVRSLPAVETLGCATVICADKTGTLTQNAMTVRQIHISGEEINVSGEGYEPHGRFIPSQSGDLLHNVKEGLHQALKTAALCNNSALTKNNMEVAGLFRKKTKTDWQVSGDPTEGALLVLAAKGGLWREVLEKEEERRLEIPFDPERKRMSVVYHNRAKKKLCVYCKGAPDVILELCDRIWQDGRVMPLTDELREQVLSANDRMASQALRVLGLASREVPENYAVESEEEWEKNLVFQGLAGMIDPPRSSAKEAVSLCRKAGIRTIMITGDHKKTAAAVAQELRIAPGGEQESLTGFDLDKMSDYQLKKAVHYISVYARVSPKHKIRIVKALKDSGHIVAMTGDGVNDAPAVKEADIGISMGLTGTDVTREASALILGNDDFATIVAAVEEGRIIYDNIRKFIRYLLSCNAGEVLTMLVASLLGLPLPLVPIQILWMNLVTDGLPAMALSLDPGNPDIMYRRPRAPQESIFAHGLPRRIMVRGTIIAAVVLCLYVMGFFFCGRDLVLARTLAFTGLVFIQLFYVFDCRSESYSLFELGFFSNPYLVLAVICSVVMQLAVIYLPFLQGVFATVSLKIEHWLMIIAMSAGTTLLQGLYRTVKIRRKRRIILTG